MPFCFQDIVPLDISQKSQRKLVGTVICMQNSIGFTTCANHMSLQPKKMLVMIQKGLLRGSN